jgi:hypothetical protein
MRKDIVRIQFQRLKELIRIEPTRAMAVSQGSPLRRGIVAGFNAQLTSALKPARMVVDVFRDGISNQFVPVGTQMRRIHI